MRRARFIRLIPMNVKRGKGRTFERMFRKDIASTSVKLKGLRRLYLLRSTVRKDDFVVLSFWNSGRDAEAYTSGAHFRDNAVNLAKFLRTKRDASKFDVVLRAVGKSFEQN